MIHPKDSEYKGSARLHVEMVVQVYLCCTARVVYAAARSDA